ncbi:MAG TPA: hypothetical protein VMI31_18415 [Fimbriimonadaceae bacterium]|nr:hypothetical protein [Fimbriimonadaceae bacterium]
MRLKAACWFFAALTAVLLVGWPFFAGLPRKGAPRSVVAVYASRNEIWLAALVLSFLLLAVFAAMVVRRTRQEYAQESAENLRRLVEGTLEDHRKRRGTETEQS